jgi:hypothetical protein
MRGLDRLLRFSGCCERWRLRRAPVGRAIVRAVVWLPGGLLEVSGILQPPAWNMLCIAGVLGGNNRLCMIDVGVDAEPRAMSQVRHRRPTHNLLWREQTMPNAVDLLTADHARVMDRTTHPALVRRYGGRHGAP